MRLETKICRHRWFSHWALATSFVLLGLTLGPALAFALNDDQALAVASRKVTVTGAKVTVLPSYKEIPWVLAVTDLQGKASISWDRGRPIPLSPSIPPYVGASVRGFRFQLLSSPRDQIASAAVVLIRSSGVSTVEDISTQIKSEPGVWQQVILSDLAIDETDPLVSVRLDFTGSIPSDAPLYIGGLVLSYAERGEYVLIDGSVPSLNIGAPSISKAVEVKKEAISKPRILIGCEIPYQVSDILFLDRYLREFFPDAQFGLSAVWTPEVRLKDVIDKLPPSMLFESEFAQFDPYMLEAAGQTSRDAKGRPLSVLGMGNLSVTTLPLWQQAVEDQIRYAATLGVRHFKRPDYVWSWLGQWGFDDYSLAAFRADLMAQDEGILLRQGDGTTVMHFWEYWRHYHAEDLTPSDLGLASWEEYTPVKFRDRQSGNLQQDRSLALYTGLIHYEWLRQAQRFGKWSAEVGGTHDSLLNPEDVKNGSDYIFLSRMVYGGTPFFEYFGGPTVVEAAYHILPLYRRVADSVGGKLGLSLEIGEGGHGQHYLAPETSFAYTLSLTGLGFDEMQSDFWEGSFEGIIGTENPYLKSRFQNFMSQAAGFYLAHEWKLKRPASRVLVVTNRSVMHHIESWSWQTKQTDSFGRWLQDANVDFIQVEPEALPNWLPQADVVFFAPLMTRPKDGKLLTEWLKQGGKTLITHSYVPYNIDKGGTALNGAAIEYAFEGETAGVRRFVNPAENLTSGFVMDPSFGKGVVRKDDLWFPENESAWRAIRSANGAPLLSEFEVGNGSRIFYVHRRLEPLRGTVADEIRHDIDQIVGLKPMIYPKPEQGRVGAQFFEVEGGCVLVAWNGPAISATSDAPGYGSHLMPGRGADQFDPTTYPYPYKVKEPFPEFSVSTPGEGNFLVYYFLSGRKETVAVDKKCLLPLKLDPVMCEVVAYGKDTPAFRAQIERIAADRMKYGKFFPEASSPKSSPPQ